MLCGSHQLHHSSIRVVYHCAALCGLLCQGRNSYGHRHTNRNCRRHHSISRYRRCCWDVLRMLYLRCCGCYSRHYIYQKVVYFALPYRRVQILFLQCPPPVSFRVSPSPEREILYHQFTRLAHQYRRFPRYHKLCCFLICWGCSLALLGG